MPTSTWYKFEVEMLKISRHLRIVYVNRPYAHIYFNSILMDIVNPYMMGEYSFEYTLRCGEKGRSPGRILTLRSIEKKLFALHSEAGRKEIKQKE